MIIAASTVDLDIILLILGILLLLIAGTLLILLLIKLNKTVSDINSILKNKKADIEKTIGNLPDLTDNLSKASGKIKDVASSVENVTDKVGTVVKTVSPGNVFSKVMVMFESAKKAFEYVSSKKRKTNDDFFDFDGSEEEEI